MQPYQEEFLIRKYHFMITSLGTKAAIGMITKSDLHEIKKGIALFEKVGYNSGIRQYKELLETALKARKRSHLSLI